MVTRARVSEPTAIEHRNEVVVIGRLSAVAVGRQLPSGDEIVTWRLIVDRPPRRGGRNYDVLSCVAFKARVRRQALSWQPGDIVEISGALRHRFWRAVSGIQSKSEVEVETASRKSGVSVVAEKPARRAQRGVTTLTSRTSRAAS
jgi:single-strand DNA-binding protein